MSPSKFCSRSYLLKQFLSLDYRSSFMFEEGLRHCLEGMSTVCQAHGHWVPPLSRPLGCFRLTVWLTAVNPANVIFHFCSYWFSNITISCATLPGLQLPCCGKPFLSKYCQAEEGCNCIYVVIPAVWNTLLRERFISKRPVRN